MVCNSLFDSTSVIAFLVVRSACVDVIAFLPVLRFLCSTTDTSWIRQLSSSQCSNRSGSVVLPSPVQTYADATSDCFLPLHGVPSECEGDFPETTSAKQWRSGLDQCSAVPRFGTNCLRSCPHQHTQKSEQSNRFQRFRFCHERASGLRTLRER